MGTMPRIGTRTTISRRQFIVSTAAFGGGMALGIFDADAAFLGSEPWAAGDGLAGAELNPWISIGADDVVVVRVATPEIGNGCMTQTPMLVAEELACDWSKIRAEFAPPSRDFRENVYALGDAPTGYFSGRSTSPERMKLMLQMGASARERLKAAAAAEWKVPVSEIATKDSVLTHTPTGRTLRYGEVAAKAAAVKLAAEPAPKPQSEWTLLGKASPPKLNIPQIVNGSAIYGMDVRVPGMVYAALRQSPVHGGRIRSFDAEKAKSMPGVLAVVTVDPDEPRGLKDMKTGAPFGYADTVVRAAVAVIAEHYWQARKALDTVQVEWDDGAGAQWKSTGQMVDACIAALDKPADKVERQSGDVKLLGKQDKIVEATYVTPFSDQAPMEPLNGTALVTADKLEVWHPSQQTKQAFWVAADEAGMHPSKVVYHQTFIGGAFGRRIFADDLRMVVAIAKKFPGRPVHTIWSREEQTRQGKYRPLVAARLRAGLDKTGMPAVLIAAQASKGHFPRLADNPYFLGCVPNVLVDARLLPIHVVTGAYRGPGYNSYVFMVESFIDECALAAGMDPLDYRLKLLSKWPDSGWAKVLHEVADKSGWGKDLPKGMAQGIAVGNWGMNGKAEAGTTVGVVATIEVTKSGLLKVHQLDAAFDCGRIVNQDAALNLVQGGLIFGLNMALNEEVNVKDGRMVEGNFDQYPVLRTGDTPQINVHFGGLSGHDRFAELGEPPAAPVGPAIANAIHRITGKRIRSTPLRKHDLSWA